MPADRLGGLQALRAVAALMIVLRHSLYDAGSLADRHMGVSQYAIDRLAAGVDIFFVISGFVIVYASRRLFAQVGASRDFLSRRLTRIVPLYWAVTTLFLVATLLAPEAINSAPPSGSLIAASYAFLPVARSDGLIMPVYSLGWTLNFEMFFYVLFGVGVMLRRNAAVFSVGAVLVLLVVAGLLLRPSNAALQFWTRAIVLEFVLGMVIAQCYLASMRVRPAVARAIAVVAGAALVASPELDFSADLARLIFWGLPAMAIVGAVVLCRGSAAASPLERRFSALGDASYALYLTHPFVMRSFKVAWRKLAWVSTTGIAAYIIVTLIAAMVLALAVHRFAERPFLAWLRRGPISSGS